MGLRLRVGQVVSRVLEGLERVAPDATFRAKRQFLRPDMAWSLTLLQRQGFRPTTAIDVGAYQGDWTELARSIWPDCSVLMIEPGAERVRALMANPDRKRQTMQALIGAAPGRVRFVEGASNSHIADDTEGGEDRDITTLDAVLTGTPFAQPDLLKVDVQGYDLDVIAGAVHTLRSVQVLVIELSLIPLHPHAPSIAEAIATLDAAGFRLLDISSLIRRPVDDAVWQMDAIFTRKDSNLGHARQGW